MRYHGAKFRFAPWVMSFFPPHTRYVESLGGAAGILIQKQKISAEVYNDLDGSIVNVFRVLQCAKSREKLIDRITHTPYARAEFELAFEATDDPVEMAARTLVAAQMGFGSAGATKGKTGFRVDSRRKYGLASHLWATYPNDIALFGERFAGVIIENRKAIDVIMQHDDADTLQLVDPPYLPETRSFHRAGCKYYAHEMTIDDHVELLESLEHVESSVVLCGYPSKLYKEMLTGWTMHSTKARISSNRGTATKTECVWLNPRCAEAQRQQRLIA